MAYKKRRYNTKKNKTKKFNKYAYAKTDSKNQAKQIVQLNKKISNVYKALKPEIVKTHASAEFEINSVAPTILTLKTLLGDVKDPISLFNGNYAKYIYFNYKFFFNSSEIDLTQGKTLRVVVFQNRIGIDELPTDGDIFAYSTQSIISSFKEGVNNNYKILFSKIYTITSDKDYLYKSYNFKKLIGFNTLAKTTASTVSNYPRGTIFIMFLTTQTANFKIKWNASLGYVDQK